MNVIIIVQILATVEYASKGGPHLPRFTFPLSVEEQTERERAEHPTSFAEV